MKNNKVLYILLAVLLAIAAYYFYTNKTGTLNEREGVLSDFMIKDTASIDKIFIADAQGGKVTLIKVNGKWMVDNNYEARPDNIRLLMKTFYRIAVKMPVPNAAFNNVVKNIATTSTKVEIYQGDGRPSKVYYLGGPTLDHQGTYMLLEKDGVKSTAPFITHIPGFHGYLTARFFTNAQQWRDAVVFRYKPKEVKRITVKYYETPAESFVIENSENQLQLFDIDGKTPVANVELSKLRNYIERYQKIYYEMVDEESTKEKIDSVVATQPFFSITVNSINGDSNQIVAYHMPNFRTLLDNKGEEFEYDIDRMYAYLNNDLFIYIQFATFDQLRFPKSYFLKNTEEN
jgi:hypothetical protein